MKPEIRLTQQQHLILTPQLQQSIRLLLLSTPELEQELLKAVEANPLLEIIESGSERTEDLYLNDKAESLESPPSQDDEFSATSMQEQEHSDEMLDSDSYAEGVNSNNNLSSTREGQDSTHYTLNDHLLSQMRLSHFSEQDMAIATTIIDAINEDGFLTFSLEEIRESLHNEIELDEILAVLHQIQNYDPPGVGARTLQECLLIQLRQSPASPSVVADAIYVIDKYIELFAAHNYRDLEKVTQFSKDQIREVVNIIQSLNPKPGVLMSLTPNQYVNPDLIVKKNKNHWVVTLNDDVLPRIRINEHYAYLLNNTHNSADVAFLSTHMDEARWLLKSLGHRNNTLFQVASCIVEQQQDFFNSGPEAIKPMILQDIASELEMHESTISRITSQKFMLTPQGIFELKYFFSGSLNAGKGEEHSSTAVRALIKRMISVEDRTTPLSDSKIQELLVKEGINVARRTIAKYRDSLGILPSHERKKL